MGNRLASLKIPTKVLGQSKLDTIDNSTAVLEEVEIWKQQLISSPQMVSKLLSHDLLAVAENVPEREEVVLRFIFLGGVELLETLMLVGDDQTQFNTISALNTILAHDASIPITNEIETFLTRAAVAAAPKLLPKLEQLRYLIHTRSKENKTSQEMEQMRAVALPRRDMASEEEIVSDYHRYLDYQDPTTADYQPVLEKHRIRAPTRRSTKSVLLDVEQDINVALEELDERRMNDSNQKLVSDIHHKLDSKLLVDAPLLSNQSVAALRHDVECLIALSEHTIRLMEMHTEFCRDHDADTEDGLNPGIARVQRELADLATKIRARFPEDNMDVTDMFQNSHLLELVGAGSRRNQKRATTSGPIRNIGAAADILDRPQSPQLTSLRNRSMSVNSIRSVTSHSSGGTFSLMSPYKRGETSSPTAAGTRSNLDGGAPSAVLLRKPSVYDTHAKPALQLITRADSHRSIRSVRSTDSLEKDHVADNSDGRYHLQPPPQDTTGLGVNEQVAVDTPHRKTSVSTPVSFSHKVSYFAPKEEAEEEEEEESPPPPSPLPPLSTNTDTDNSHPRADTSASQPESPVFSSTPLYGTDARNSSRLSPSRHSSLSGGLMKKWAQIQALASQSLQQVPQHDADEQDQPY